MRRTGQLVVLVCAAMLAVGCATTSPPPIDPIAAAQASATAVSDLETRSLLLLVADRRAWEPVTLQNAIDAADPDVRRQAALAAGRIGDPRSVSMLEFLLADPLPEVRRAAVFALGELELRGKANDRQIVETLLNAVADPDRQTGRLAVEGLAKLGVTLGTVVERLIQGTAEEFEPRLLPSLFRFRQGADEGQSRAVLRWAEQGLDRPEPELRAMAAYALARVPLPQSLPRLRELLGAGDPWVRGLAARALGILADNAEREDLERLRPLLDDAAPGPTIQALRATRSILATGVAAAPESWRPRLLELLADPHPGIRVTAIEASSAWLLDEELGEILARFATEGLRRERELALVALAEGEDPRAASLLVKASEDSKASIRASAASAAVFFGADEILDRLTDDPDPGVRRAVLDMRLLNDPETAVADAREALADKDFTVRAQALIWATREPLLSIEEILEGMEMHPRPPVPEARLRGIEALAARAEAEPLERGAIYSALDKLAADADFLVRREAIDALRRLDQKPPELGAFRGTKSVQAYREIVQRTARPRVVEMLTERGTVRLELACPEAPLTCLSFLQLAVQGFYDGLVFHRVVPDFVIQAGDPRGDGWGGPGYSLRDEPNLLRYSRGSLGMARSGPDTAGSQFFITLAPQPHLDGAYTTFGRVLEGDDVLDAIVQGDRILRIFEVPAG